MLQYPRARLAGPLAALALLAAACSRSESPRTAEASSATASSPTGSPAPASRVTSSAGDVAVAGGTSLADSISTIADKARIHPNAQAAAEAAMCAGVQGKFWELHSSLFDTQAKWAPLKSPLEMFESLARAAGVEPKAWNSCMSTHATAKVIEADRDRSTRAGVESTPTFFVGDRALAGAYPIDTFRVAIDQALAKAKAAAP